eukprot:NODE_3228_length_1020_cov_29.564367_g2969_i0.p1 GENE.NODE_3228_length_1020_cov_29.564367_g2969_i0~~NODE_3228_length_1020_cov_29.564367_g2969_i0.p1  ORF type:complete len:234 (+),score=37.85 NODE_3228_length_1020_cov_29.564367_g2969_i0:96-797(+)
MASRVSTSAKALRLAAERLSAKQCTSIPLDRWNFMSNPPPGLLTSKKRYDAKITALNLMRTTTPFLRQNYSTFHNAFGCGERFFANQMFLWNVHLWLLFRRLDFEKDAEFIVHMLTKEYMERIRDAHACEDEEKVSSRQKMRERSLLTPGIYAFWLAFDDAIDEDSDRHFVTALYRNSPILSHVENLSFEQLNNIVRYVRFQLCFLDCLPSDRILSAAFDWPAPQESILGVSK